MFDLYKKEFEDFYAENMERVASILSPRRNCKKYMDKLLADGHKLILITYRAYPHYKHAKETTIAWLNKHKINYTELVFSQTSQKIDECRKYKVDLMVDDRIDKCQIMRENGINCYLMLTNYNRDKKWDLPFVSSWANLYEVVSKYNSNTKN